MSTAAGNGPLSGRIVAAYGTTATARLANQLLGDLGATVDWNDAVGERLLVPSGGASEQWASSGAMALTGRADGPPLPVIGAPASAVAAALAVFVWITDTRDLPGSELLGERAALLGLTRHAPWSVGGAFRLLPARDGWLGISLPRPEDLAMLPALTEADIDDPWPDLATWLVRTSIEEAIERTTMLGMAAAELPSKQALRRAPVLSTAGGDRMIRPHPRVLDLSSLWAGPLCTHLLTRAGADVVKIETGDRPDGARRGDPAFFDLLHAGQRAVTVDLDSDALGRLIAAADLVIEGSRPRALRQLGVVAEDVVAAGTSWLSITAYGRGPTDELRVGFGDDVAAGAGLVGWDGGMPVPAADALADPLAGVYAAAAAAAALAAPRAYLLDVSMHDTARLAAGIYEIEPARNDASVEPQAPRGRQPAGRAPRVGEHNPDLLAPSH